MALPYKDNDKETCIALKTVSNSNQQLTIQADKKAHILIQVSALMISVLLIFILRINDDHRIALLPVSALMMTCLVVIILALMATRPRVPAISPIETPGANSPRHLRSPIYIHRFLALAAAFLKAVLA